MKSKVRNLLTTGFASLTAVLLSLSVVCCKPLELNNQSGTAGTGSSEPIDVTDVLGSQLDTTQFMDSDLLSSSQAKVKSDGTRRVIVEMESDSMLDVYLGSETLQKKYGSLTDYVNAAEGRQYTSALNAEQNSFITALNRSSVDYEIRHTYTSIINGMSLIIDDDDVSALENIDGVKSIIYSESYAVPEAEATINDVSVYSTGIYDSSEIAYSGKGMAVAVLDTGFDRSHDAFQEMPAEEDQKITQSDVREKFNELAATTQGASISVSDVYYNAKVPFAYDYADDDADVFPKSSSHGLHVAGVIAGHEEGLSADDGEAFENNSTFRGVAPDAQLVICKVFPDQEDGLEGGAETDDILAALSDCITLGVDVINMSLGVSAGFSREEDGNAINEVYDKVYEAGINLVVAASNSGSSAQNGAYGSTNLTSNPDSGTVGSPSTYAGALSVASISGQKSSYLQLEDGTAVYFNESSNASGEQGDFVAEILDTYFDGADEATVNFVVVPGTGDYSNYTAAVQSQLDKGNCIAVVARGVTNFEDKQRIAFENGAIGCIIYNNLSGRINASLGTGKKIPTCTVTADIGQTLVNLGSGTITINRDYKAGPFMSDFSSWGPTSDLKIKPEITAHGGEITSTVVGGYSIYSGTSMASPNMAGAVTLLRQHVSETYGLTGTELSDRVNQLLMSTATIVLDERGLPYAVRRQGAGLGDIGKAIASDAYIYVENNSKPKLELGDDPDRTGVYTMEFKVSNMSQNTKTYTLGAMVMTESVSIDGITVAEQSYMLDDAKKTYYVNGSRSSSGTVTLRAEEEATVKVTIELTAAQKDYLDQNFENGMYVEGFITLEDADSEGVDLSVPYLAYYGNWLDAPIFDATVYEVSADEHNTAIEDIDKTVAAVYESVVIGRYYRGTETYIPLGQYVYDAADEDSGIEAMVDKIAVGNSDYGVYEFYAVYFGLLRSVEAMDVVISNSVTGEVVWSDTINMIGKSYSTTPSYAEIGIQPYELNLQNNTKYTATFTTRATYNGRQSEEQVQTFTFYVDYEAPYIYRNENLVRFEYDVDDPTLRHAYLDLYLYDNHYVQSLQLFTYAEAESDVDWATEDMSGTIDWLTEYSIPVESSRGAVNRVTVEITDWLDNLISVEGETDKYIGVRIDDYALNSAAYIVPVQFPEVSKVDIDYSYVDDNGTTLTQSLAGGTVVMSAGADLDFTDEDDTGVIQLTDDVNSRVNGARFELNLYNYGIYSCSECGFSYDEHLGYSYSVDDYYYDSDSGRVLQRTSADTTPTYPAGTLFRDIIADENYSTRHFVCPDCGTEVTFTYNSRSDTLTLNNFTKDTPDAMTEEVIWESSDSSVARVWNGRLYAVSAGTATITAYAPDAAIYPYPMDSDPYATFSFTVIVEGESSTPSVSGLSVGSYDNLTLGTSRNVSGGSISVDNGTKLVLYPKLNPWYVDSASRLTWSTSDANGVEILQSDSTQATVLCKQPGTYEIYLYSGRLTGTFTISVDEEYVLTSTYFYEYNGPGYSETITDENGESRNVLVIPANLGITNLGHLIATQEGPFYENTDIDTVIVPEGVTTIGLSCFANSSIRRIYLPSSLIAISLDAFANCENLEEVYWFDASEDSRSGIVYNADQNTYNWDVFFEAASPEMTSQSLVIGSEAFLNCVRLNTISLAKATAVYDFAFSGCSSLTGTVDLSKIRFSGMGVFYGCTGITGVTLTANTVLGAYMFAGTGITSIEYFGSYVGDRVFAEMPNLQSVILRNASGNFSTLNTIGARAFEGCTALTSVTFERTFTALGDYAFAGCTSLERIELPATMSSIGNYAFMNCSSLGEVVLDSSTSLISTGNDMFSGCSQLKKITLDDENNTTIYRVVSAENGEYTMITDTNGNPVLVPPAYPVSSDSQTVTVGSGNTVIGAQAYANNNSLDGKTLVISDDVTEIGSAAFAGTGITKVVIPASVKVFGDDIFAYCENLESVVFLGDISEIPAGMFRGCNKLVSVQIPDSVTSIGDYAFYGAALKTLEIGRNVTSVGNYSFADNDYLTTLTFAANSRLESIGDNAFSGCVSLGSVELPDSVTAIGDRAFFGDEALRSAYISASLREMGDYAFAGCNLLSSAEFGYGAQVVGNYAFASGDGEVEYTYYLTDVTIPSTVTSIGDYAFAGNAAIVQIDLSGVERIGSHAFYRTPALTTVTVDSDMSYVGISAFEESAVRDIDLSGIEYFDARSFYGTAVSDGDFNDAIEIGEYAFYNCRQFTSLTFTQVEQIYSSAFYIPMQDEEGNTVNGTISSITLGDKLIGLGGGAFYNSAIRRIALPASLEIIGTPAFSGCLNLTAISVASGNETFFTNSGALYKNLPNGTYELVCVPNGIVLNGTGENMRPFSILEGTSRIGDWAMAFCENIHAVRIPASVQSIGAYGFYRMGYAILNNSSSVGALSRELFPKYIFEGLEAPTLETNYVDEEAVSLVSLYYTFTYDIGYLYSDMIIPANATGFDSVVYEYFFMNTEYSDELIEENTQSIITSIEAIDIDSLTADDANTINRLQTSYLMLTDGQKAFVSDELVEKLNAAVERVAELTGGDNPGDTPGGDNPSGEGGGSSCENAGLIGGICGGVGGLIVVAAVIIVLMIMRRKKAASQSGDGIKTDYGADGEADSQSGEEEESSEQKNSVRDEVQDEDNSSAKTTDKEDPDRE